MLRNIRCWIVVGGLAGVLAHTHTEPPAKDDDACSSAKAEENLKKREKALLGNKHANARAHHCKVAKGKGGKPAKPDDAALAVAKNNPASSVAAWSEPFVIPVAGITAILLNTGKVLFWSYEPTQYRNPNASNTGVAWYQRPFGISGTAAP